MSDENITVLILNNVKRVKSIKVNRRRVRVAVFIGLLFMSVFILSLGANYFLYQENQDVSMQLALLGESRPAGLETIADDDVNGSGGSIHAQESTVNLPREDEMGQRVSTEEVPGAPTEEVDIFEGDFNSERVGIENLEATLEINKIELNISFNVVNRLETNDAVAGYVVIVAKTTDGNMPYVSWPYMTINANGVPADFTKGDRFTINYLRPTNARIMLNDPSERYSYYRINIYSLSGELMMKRTFRVN
ncbi:hypothetical protein ACFL6I_24325 [candidate division KSB1 bacterium]